MPSSRAAIQARGTPRRHWRAVRRRFDGMVLELTSNIVLKLPKELRIAAAMPPLLYDSFAA